MDGTTAFHGNSSTSTKPSSVTLVIEVLGGIKPKGSMRAVRVNMKNGVSKVKLIPSGASAESEHVIRSLAVQALQSQNVNVQDIDRDGPRYVKIMATIPRPKSHYRTGKHRSEIKMSSPLYPCTKPDIDKLARTVLDALTGILWRDDAQVVSLEIVKRYDAFARATIEAGPINANKVV